MEYEIKIQSRLQFATKFKLRIFNIDGVKTSVYAYKSNFKVYIPREKELEAYVYYVKNAKEFDKLMED